MEISIDYLRKWLPSDELQADNRGGYLLAVRSASQTDGTAYTCEPVAKNGSLLMQLLETGPFAFSASNAHTGAYTVVSPDSGDRDIDGQTAALKLYNTHTPFEDDQWVLTGLVYRRDLLDASLKLQRTILLSLGISLVLGIASILLAAKIITKPVTNLAQKLRESRRVARCGRVDVGGRVFRLPVRRRIQRGNPQHRPQPAQPAARYHRTAAGPGKQSGHRGGFPGIRTTPPTMRN